MLAKQFWSLIQKPDSMVFRILKAKYFRRKEIRQADLGYKPSYLWRSLLAARELVEEGIAWRIGNGKTVDIWQDRWIGVEKYARTRSLRKEGWQEMKVADLIDEESSMWKEDVVSELLEPDEAQSVIKISLSRGAVEDRIIWRFTKKVYSLLNPHIMQQ